MAMVVSGITMVSGNQDPVGLPSYPREERTPPLLIPDVGDSTSQFYQFSLQFFPAKLTDTFPNGPLTEIPLSRWVSTTESYKMKVCEKVAISDCMPSRAPLFGSTNIVVVYMFHRFAHAFIQLDL